MNSEEPLSEEDERANARASTHDEWTANHETRRMGGGSTGQQDVTPIDVLHSAAHLHSLLNVGNDGAAAEFLSLGRLNLDVLKKLLELRALDEQALAKNLRDVEAQLADIARKNRERSRKAQEARKLQSKNPGIKAWLRAQEANGVNINERYIAGQIGSRFLVSATYARNIRAEYINEKSSKRN